MRRYSEEVRQFITQNVEGKTTKELVEHVNTKFGRLFTESKIISYKSKHKLKSGTPCGLPAGRPTNLYSEEIRNFIKKNHPGNGPKNMTELLNKTFETNYTEMQIKAYYSRHKIDSGLDGRFSKGNTPWNKGKKGYYASGCEKGWFKKGQISINNKPVGSERVDTDGYTLVKTEEPNVWELKHRVIWEEKNGKVPEGHVLTFLDRNKSNITLDNLALITMAESMELTRSKLRSENPEFTKIGILITKIKITRNKLKKRKAEGRS